MDEIYKGNIVTLETLAGGQLAEKLTDITAELTEGEINGEYKNYEYTIDSNLEVTINGAVSGVRITGRAVVQTEGYVFEGSTVEIKVTASVTEGTITGITAPEEATLKTNTSTTEKVYEVSNNGKYVFKITSDSGKTKDVTANVENILSTPQITVSEITESSFKINVENNYPEGVITEYKYYVGGTVKQEGTTDKSYTVTGLTEETEYSNIKVVAYINSINKESNTQTATTEKKKKQLEYQLILEEQIKEKKLREKQEKEKQLKEDLLYEEKIKQEQEKLLLEQKEKKLKKQNIFILKKKKIIKKMIICKLK